LAAFFVSSNLVSPRVIARGRSPRSNPAGLAEDTEIATAPSDPRNDFLDPKGNRRDAWQVYANGGAAAVLSLVGSSDPAMRTWLVTASLAAAGADTWATSVGARSGAPPRLLWSGQTVSPGTSGGVSALGNLGALAGAAIVAGTGALTTGKLWLLPVGILIGFLGMLMDSLAGGALQGRFWCPRCERPSEWRTHRCGTVTEWRAGWKWLNNDGVNLLATALAGALAWAIWWWFD
jgi:uncharacterized membrane protein